jgi:chemosensory pili system protein ChpE
VFWTAFALGIAMCAPPGVVTAEAVRRGIRRGFAGALCLELGSLVGDAAWAALALFGAAYLASSRWALVGLGVVGVGLLFYLGGRALAEAWTGAVPVAGNAAYNDFWTGAVLSVSNPFQFAFWLGLGGTAAVLTRARPDALGPVGFFAAFMLAAALWAVLFAAAVAWGRRYLAGTFYRCVNALCGAALLYFAFGVLNRLLRDAAGIGIH